MAEPWSGTAGSNTPCRGGHLAELRFADLAREMEGGGSYSRERWCAHYAGSRHRWTHSCWRNGPYFLPTLSRLANIPLRIQNLRIQIQRSRSREKPSPHCELRAESGLQTHPPPSPLLPWVAQWRTGTTVFFILGEAGPGRKAWHSGRQ